MSVSKPSPFGVAGRREQGASVACAREVDKEGASAVLYSNDTRYLIHRTAISIGRSSNLGQVSALLQPSLLPVQCDSFKSLIGLEMSACRLKEPRVYHVMPLARCAFQSYEHALDSRRCNLAAGIIGLESKVLSIEHCPCCMKTHSVAKTPWSCTDHWEDSSATPYSKPFLGYQTAKSISRCWCMSRLLCKNIVHAAGGFGSGKGAEGRPGVPQAGAAHAETRWPLASPEHRQALRLRQWNGLPTGPVTHPSAPQPAPGTLALLTQSIAS